MDVALVGVENRQSMPIAENAPPSPHSPVSGLGQSCEVAGDRSPTVFEHAGRPNISMEASSPDVALVEPLETPPHKAGEELACVPNAAPTTVDELSTVHMNVDESSSAPSRRGRICGLLPAISLSALTAADRTASVGELFTARAVDDMLTARSDHVAFELPFAELLTAGSDHVALELPFLTMMAQPGATEVASPSAVTPRGVEPSQENINPLAHTGPTEMSQSGYAVLDSIDCGTAIAQVSTLAPSASPPVCESASAIRATAAPARVAPKSGLQERLQALAAAGLLAHVVAAAPPQDSSDGGSSPSSTTALSVRELAASRKGSVGDGGAGACEAEGEAGGHKIPRVPESQLLREMSAETLSIAGPSPSSLRPGFADPASTKISAEQLRETCAEARSISQLDGGVAVDPQRKEMYLSDEEFQQIFGMPHAAFAEMAKWKQHALKKLHGLF